MVSQLKSNLFIAVYGLIASIYYRADAFRFVNDCLTFPISISALYIMYKYLKSRPVAQQTVMTGQMKLLLLFSFVSFVRASIKSIMLNLIPEATRTLVQDHPTLICSLSTPRLVLLPLCMIVSFLMFTKLFIVLYPHQFFNLNHDTAIRVIAGLIAVAMITDVVVGVGIHGHYCNKQQLSDLEIILDIHTNGSTYKITPWLLILGILGVLAELTSSSLIQYRAWKQRRAILPVSLQPARVFVMSSSNAQFLPPVAPAEPQHSNEQKITQNITLTCLVLQFILVWMKILSNASDTRSYREIFLIIYTIFQNAIGNILPLVWITGSDESVTFAFRMIKELILSSPQVIQDFCSKFTNLEEMN